MKKDFTKHKARIFSIIPCYQKVKVEIDPIAYRFRNIVIEGVRSVFVAPFMVDSYLTIRTDPTLKTV